MDYCGKALECTTLDGWAVYRNRSPQYNVGAGCTCICMVVCAVLFSRASGRLGGGGGRGGVALCVSECLCLLLVH